MQEARIILPSSADGHGWLRAELRLNFDGYIRYQAQRNFQGKVEDVVIYDITCDNSGTTTDILTETARGLLHLTTEEAIYLRYPDDEVIFLTV